MKSLDLQNVYVEIDGKEILRDVSFTISNSRQRWVIGGKNGSGKSTLLKSIAGQQTIHAGKIYLDSKRLSSENLLVKRFDEIGYVSQKLEIPPHITIIEWLKLRCKVKLNVLESLISQFGVEHLLNRFHNQISGGEAQIISMIHGIVQLPSLLLLDEPFSQLDYLQRQRVRKLLINTLKEWSISSIWVLHDPTDIFFVGTHIMILQEGAITESKTIKQMYQKPFSKYSASLLGEYNIIHDEPFEIVRPENLQIHNSLKSESIKKGIITTQQYMGHYYRLEIVDENKKTWIAYTNASNYKQDDTIYFT